MTPTTWRTLVPAGLAAAVLGWLLLQADYGSVVTLPTYAAVTAGLVAVFELVLTRVIGQRIRGATRGRQVHPLQVARAAALAKASSLAGALLVGLYAGFSAWLLPKRGTLAAAQDDLLVAVVSGVACIVLLVAALLLERACRTPEPRDD